jgi:hypothetical protein
MRRARSAHLPLLHAPVTVVESTNDTHMEMGESFANPDGPAAARRSPRCGLAAPEPRLHGLDLAL